MRELIKKLEIVIAVFFIICIIGFIYLLINLSLLKDGTASSVGPIIKLEIDTNDKIHEWHYECSIDSIIKVKKHSEINDDNVKIMKYMLMPNAAGETTIIFSLYNKETGENDSKKTYNIEVTDLGNGVYSASIVE